MNQGDEMNESRDQHSKPLARPGERQINYSQMRGAEGVSIENVFPLLPCS
jgi:hypothetical protein